MSDAVSTSRLAVIAQEVILREGLALIVGGATVEVVACVASLRELDQLDVPFDVVLVHLRDASDVAAFAERRFPDVRVVGVHDSLPPALVGVALAAGFVTLVDTSADPASLIDAVAGSEARTRLRWTRPTIGPMPLTPRERSVLALVADGRTSGGVAAALGISIRTVEQHKQRIFERLGVQNQAHAVAIALRAGLLEPATSTDATAAGQG
ncbi:MAG: hypothetical protein JWL73_380 [Actinomycetia bacterium]|nr:hypothetical protein [Actinomycetes bacterium]